MSPSRSCTACAVREVDGASMPSLIIGRRGANLVAPEFNARRAETRAYRGMLFRPKEDELNTCALVWLARPRGGAGGPRARVPGLLAAARVAERAEPGDWRWTELAAGHLEHPARSRPGEPFGARRALLTRAWPGRARHGRRAASRATPDIRPSRRRTGRPPG